MNRDEYIEKLKAQLDDWNRQSKDWESKAREAQGQAQQEFRKRLDELSAQREKVAYQLKLMQNASADAFGDMLRGADAALKSMHDAFDQASKHFQKGGKG